METASTPAPYVAAADGDLAPKAAEPASTPKPTPAPRPPSRKPWPALTETVNRAPLHREIFLKLLAFCTTQRTLAEAEEAARACPEFSSVAPKPLPAHPHPRARRRPVLAGAGRDGPAPDAPGQGGLTPDEIEDATFAYAVVTTPVGEPGGRGPRAREAAATPLRSRAPAAYHLPGPYGLLPRAAHLQGDRGAVAHPTRRCLREHHLKPTPAAELLRGCTGTLGRPCLERWMEDHREGNEGIAATSLGTPF